MPEASDQLITLPDGRQLAIRDYGDPGHFPVLHLAGAPGGCRLDAERWRERAVARRLRVLGVDRPGIGLSDRHVGGSMADWTDDARALLDALALERVAVIAVSGGGPFGLALAGALPERVVHLTLVAPAWIAGRGGTRGMPGFNRLLWWSARRAPALFRAIIDKLMRPMLLDPERSIASSMPPPDQRALAEHPQIERSFKAGFAEAIRGGVEGVIDDARLIVGPQPRAPRDISPPVTLWHGQADRNVPIAIGRRLAAELPRCDARLLAGEGHISILVHHMDAMLDALRRRVDAALARGR